MSTGVSAGGGEATVQAVRVCASGELVDGGTGVRRAARIGADEVVVFFVRYEGRVHAISTVALTFQWSWIGQRASSSNRPVYT